MSLSLYGKKDNRIAPKEFKIYHANLRFKAKSSS